MGNQQAQEEKKEENPKDLPTLETKIISSPAEDVNILQKQKDISQEEISIEQKEFYEEPKIKLGEKYPYNSTKVSKNLSNLQEVADTQILSSSINQKEQKESQNITDQNLQVNQEPNKEMSYSANFNVNSGINLKSSNPLKNTDLDQFIKNDKEMQQISESQNKNQDNQNEAEDPNKGNDGDIQVINTNLKIDSLHVNNNSENNIQKEEPYMDNNLDINNMNNNINTDYFNANNNPENNIQTEEPYMDNNLDIGNISKNIDTNLPISFLNSNVNQNNQIQTEETNYTFNADIFKSTENQTLTDYIYNGNIFADLNNNNNITNDNNTNSNINEYNYNYNIEENNNNINPLEQNVIQNIVEDNNYITSTSNDENIQFIKTLPIQYLPTKYENLDSNINNNINNDININPDINNINKDTNNIIPDIYNINTDINNNNNNETVNIDFNYNIGNNKFSFGEILPEENVQNVANIETHFTEKQNIYDSGVPNVNEEPKKENENEIKIEIENNNVQINNQNVIEQPDKEKENQTNMENKVQNLNLTDTIGNTILLNNKDNDNNNLDNNVNVKINDDDFIQNLQESKTMPIKKESNKSLPKPPEEENKINIIDENKENNIKNVIKDEILIDTPGNNGEEIKVKENNINKNDENILNISNQIKEIKEMPEKPFEQRDYIFNKNNIKVIKIEDEETHFCSDLLSPLFKKIFG